MAPDPLAPVFTAYREGVAAMLVSGRDLGDFTVDEEALRPLLEVLRRRARVECGAALISFSRAEGVVFDARGWAEADARTIRRILDDSGLTGIPQDEHEVARTIRSLLTAARAPREERASDDRPISLFLLIQYAEHVVANQPPGTQTETELLTSELAHLAVTSLAVRAAGNLVILLARDEALIDPLVSGALHRVHLALPGQEEKKEFIEAALTLYPDARLEEGLTPASVAFLMSNTWNRTTEARVRASARGGRPLTAHELALQKQRDVAALSEGSLGVLDDARAAGVELVGRNAETPMRIMRQFGEALRRGDAALPLNILLSGPPGGGKTMMAILAARAARTAAIEARSPKHHYVGETERRSRLQWGLIREFSPVLVLIDEFSEVMPVERGTHGDSGATDAVLGALLTALSDESRRGKALLVATTNVPGRLGEAMRSRFAVIPVLHPLLDDMPQLVSTLTRQVDPGWEIDAEAGEVRDAAREFYRKGCSAREIRSALSLTLALGDTPGLEAVTAAARATQAWAAWPAIEAADLAAIRLTNMRSFFPWAADPAAYPFPDHLLRVVDAHTGEVDREALDRRLQELRDVNI